MVYMEHAQQQEKTQVFQYRSQKKSPAKNRKDDLVCVLAATAIAGIHLYNVAVHIILYSTAFYEHAFK